MEIFSPPGRGALNLSAGWRASGAGENSKLAVSTVLMIWVGSDGAQQSITDLHVEGNL